MICIAPEIKRSLPCFTGYLTLYLVFGVSLPLSAEAVIKFGPMHIPIATKGYENLFKCGSCEPQKSRWFHLMQFWFHRLFIHKILVKSIHYF